MQQSEINNYRLQVALIHRKSALNDWQNWGNTFFAR